MTQYIARDNRNDEGVDLTNSESTTEAIDFRQYSGGMVYIPNGSSITTLTFWAAPKPDGTYEPLKDSSNNAVTRTVAADGAYALPDECFGAGAIKMVANASGTVSLSLKG